MLIDTFKVFKMNDNSKTQQQLIQELAAMRQRVGQMEQSELDRKKAEEALRENKRVSGRERSVTGISSITWRRLTTRWI